MDSKRLMKNTSFQFLKTVVIEVIGLITFTFLTIYLGAEGYGILSFAWAYTGIFGTILNLGLNVYTTREIAKENFPKETFLGDIFTIKIFLSLGVLGIISFSFILFSYSLVTELILCIITFSTITIAFNQILHALYRAYEKMHYNLISGSISSIFSLVGTLIGIYLRASIYWFALTALFGNLGVLFLNIYISKSHFIIPKFDISFERLTQIVKQATPFGVSSILAIIIKNLPLVILFNFTSDKATGFFSLAYKISFATGMLYTSFNLTLLPFMAKLSKKSEKQLAETFKRSFKYLFILGLYIGFGGTFLADELIMLIWGKSFKESIILLRILIWAQVGIYFQTTFSTLVTAVGKQELNVKKDLLRLTTFFLCSLLLTPFLKSIGTSLSFVICQFMGTIFIASYTTKMGYRLSKPLPFDVLKICIASIIYGGYLHLVDFSVFLLVPTASILYFGLIFLLKGFDNKDRKIIKQLLPF